MESKNTLLEYLGTDHSDALNSLTEGRHPLVAPHLRQIDAVATSMLDLIDDVSITLPEGQLSLFKAIHKKRNLIAYDFAKVGDTLKRSAISIQKYPIHYAANALHRSSPELFKLVTKLGLINWQNSSPISTSRFERIIKEIFTGVFEVTTVLSNLIIPKNLYQSVLVLQSFLSRYSAKKEEQDLTTLITQLLDLSIPSLSSNYKPINTLTFDATQTEESSADSEPISVIEIHDEEARIDADDLVEQLRAVYTPSDVAQKSSYYQRSYARQTQLKNASRAQFLDNANEALTDLEFFQIIDTSCKGISQNDEVAFSILLTQLTGAEPLYWWDWDVYLHSPGCSSKKTQISLDQGVYKQIVEPSNRFWKPSADNTDLVIPVQNELTLPLPDTVINFLKSRMKGESEKLGEILQIGKDEVFELCDNWLSKHINLGRRITTAKVRNSLYWRIMKNSFDEVAASFICSQPILATPILNAYTTLKHSYLEELYVSMFKQLEYRIKPHENNKIFIGSYLHVHRQHIIDTFNKLAYEVESKSSKIQNKSSLNEILELHNSFTSYCVFSGLMNTAHRPNIDPFARVVDFIPAINAVFISDKIVNEEHESHISFYSDSFKHQLATYNKHINLLQSWLNHFGYSEDSSLLLKVVDPKECSTLPYFFYLRLEKNNKLNFESISAKSLNEAIPSFRLPMNAGRHFLATELRERGLSPEFISYQLGQSGPGEQPYSISSILSPEIVSKALVPKLNTIFNALTPKTITGLNFVQQEVHNLYPTTEDGTRVLGPVRRILNAKAKTKASREIVKEIYQEYIDSVSVDIFFKNSNFIVQQATDSLISRSGKNSIRNIVLFTYLLKRFSKKHNLQLSLPTKLIEIKTEASPFNYLTIPLWHQLQLIRLEFIQLIEKESFESLSSTKKLVYFFLSLMIFSRYTHKKRFPQILEAIYKNKFWTDKGQVYIDVKTRKSQIERVALDGFSGLLFDHVTKIYTEDSLHKISFKSIEHELKKLLTKFKTKTITLPSLMKAVEIDAALFYPGILRASQAGIRPIASLKKASFVRVMKGIRLNADVTVKTAQAGSPINLKLVNLQSQIFQASSSGYSFKPCKKMLSDFHHHLNNKSLLSRKELTNVLISTLDDLGKKFNNVPQIVYILGAWSVERLNSPGEIKEKLSIGTIYDYYISVSTSLLERLLNTSVFDILSTEFVDIYNAIIASSTGENQTHIAAQLTNFHNTTCSKYFGVEPIKKTDLEYISKNPAEHIDANFITPQENRGIQNLILDSDSPEFFKRQSALIFNLTAKLGQRVNETYKLELTDIAHPTLGYKGYVTNRQNALAGLKNPQSFRSSFLTGKLTPDEEELLLSWLETRKSMLKKELWTSDLNDKNLNKNLFYDHTLHAMRIYTGDTNLKARSLRHTSVTMEYLAYFDHTLRFLEIESNLDKDFQLSEWFGNGVDHYLKTTFAYSNPSRRFAHRTARNHGHSGPGTSLSNYGHFYEFVVPYFHKQGMKDISFKSLIKVAPTISIDSIKSLRRRANRDCPDDRNLADKKAILGIADKVYKESPNSLKALAEKLVAKGRKPTLLQVHAPQLEISIIKLFELLLYLKASMPVDSLSLMNRFGLSVETVEQIKNGYQDLYLKTGLNPLSLPLDTDSRILFNTASALKETQATLSDRLKLIPKLNSFIDKPVEGFIDGLNTWANYVQPHKTFWFFERQEHIDSIHTMLSLMLKDPLQRVFLATDKKSEHKTMHPTLGIQKRYAKQAESAPISRTLNPRISQKVNGLGLLSRSKKRYLNPEINLLLFLAKLALDQKPKLG